MRIPPAPAAAFLFFVAACASTPPVGSLGDGGPAPRILAVDSVIPPRSISVQLNQPSYAAVLLVAPGHSATLLYPRDSVTDNRLPAGPSTIAFEVPALLAQSDSAMQALRRERQRQVQDSSLRRRTRANDTRSSAPVSLPMNTPTYLLVVTSAQPLNYGRIIEKTAGVSIPLVETEALNAVGKAIKATLLAEPRAWAGAYQLITLFRQ